MEYSFKYFLSNEYFKAVDDAETTRIKKKIELPKEMERYFPLTKKIYNLPDEFDVPKTYIESLVKNLQSKLTSWSKSWAKTREALLQQIKPIGEIDPQDAAILLALDNVIYSMNLLINILSGKNENNNIIPIDLLNHLWGELSLMDRLARYMLKETDLDMKFETFDQSTSENSTNIKMVEASFQAEKQSLLMNMKNKKFYIPESLRDCTSKVRKDTNFGLVRLEVRNFSKAGPLEAFIGDNIIQIWNCINCLDRDTEEQEDSIFLLVKDLHKCQQKGRVDEELYLKIKLTTDQLAEEIRPFVSRKQFPYDPLPKTLAKADKAAKNKFAEPSRRSNRERKIKVRLDDEIEVDKENKPPSVGSTKKLKLNKTKKENEVHDTVQNFGLTEPLSNNVVVKVEPPEEVVAPEPSSRTDSLPDHSIKNEPNLEVPVKREKRTSKPTIVFTPPHAPDTTETDSASESETAPSEDYEEDEFEEPAPKRRRSHPKQRTQRVPVREVAQKEEKISEIDIVLMNERIFMEEIKLQLFGCRKVGGSFFTRFIPTILDSIDRAVEALDAWCLEDYTIHKTSVEMGTTHLIDCLKQFEKEHLIDTAPPNQESNQETEIVEEKGLE